jgi:hypothetical protein
LGSYDTCLFFHASFSCSHISFVHTGLKPPAYQPGQDTGKRITIACEVLTFNLLWHKVSNSYRFLAALNMYSTSSADVTLIPKIVAEESRSRRAKRTLFHNSPSHI